MIILLLLGCSKDGGGNNMFQYQSNPKGWNAFLTCWQEQTVTKLSSQEELYTEYEKQVFSSQRQMFEPTSKKDINQLEKRLGVKLPASYTDFLTVTNGWIQLQLDAEDGLLFDTANVGQLCDKCQESYHLLAW